MNAFMMTKSKINENKQKTKCFTNLFYTISSLRAAFVVFVWKISMKSKFMIDSCWLFRMIYPNVFKMEMGFYIFYKLS